MGGEIIAIAQSASWDELVAAFAEHGHSRMPVFANSLDDITALRLQSTLLSQLGRPRDALGMLEKFLKD